MVSILEIAQSLFHFLTGYYFKPLSDSGLASQAMTHIIILGGGYAGVSTAHRILKHAAKTGPFKITLVSQNTDFYWSMAAPRGLVPGQFPDEKLFQPIVPGFKQYSAQKFEFILATVESVDFDAKTVDISGSSGKTTLDYDFLIIATGSHTEGNTPFKSLGSTEATKEALHDFQARVQKAHTIVVAGAGVTGVEVAGELAFEYGRSKKIILVSCTPPHDFCCDTAITSF